MFDILPKEKKILVPAGVILMSNVQTCLIFPQARSSSENAHPLQRQNSPRAEADTDFFSLGEEVIYKEIGLEKKLMIVQSKRIECKF